MKLLHHFYADVRQHREIGPIFVQNITDWPQHLEKIADFWSTVAGGPPSYSGPMAARHMHLGLKEEHFNAWLGLWEHNCRIWLPTECAQEMIQFAQSIAGRLRQLTGGVSLGIHPKTANLGVRQYGQLRPIPFQSEGKT